MEGARERERNGKPADSIEESMIGYYQFPEEEPFHVRQQQRIIEDMNNSDVAVTISTSSSMSPSPSQSQSQMEDIVTKTIDAKTIASEKNLLKLFSSGSASSSSNNVTVAVDFLDRHSSGNITTDNNVDNVGETELVADGSLMTDIESMANSNSGKGYKELSDAPSASQQIAQETQSMSKWAYTPSQQQGSGDTSKNGTRSDSRTTQLSDVEMKMSQLEYEISELERDLRDPMCTRNIDDMTTALRKAKRELSKLRWKRRFGLA